MDSHKNILAGLRQYRSPIKTLLIIALSIFVVETLIMVALIFIEPDSNALLSLLDAVVLIILVSPVLYFFMLKPLIRLVDERDLAIRNIGEERDRAQRYLDIAGVLIVVLDSNGVVSLINRKGCKTLGCGEGDIIGRDWFTGFVPARIRNEVTFSFRGLISGEKDAEGYFEYPVLTKSGEERTILWHNTILREDGRVTGTLSSGEDITERKRTEKALKEREIKYRSLHNTAFDAIIIADELDKVTECNPSAEEMFGYETGSMIGVTVPELMPEKYRERHSKKIAEFLKTGISTTMGRVLEMEGLRKNGEVFPIEIVLNTFVIGAGRFFTGTIRDITARKMAEKEKDLIQARLNQAQKMEAIGRFSGGIAHDFNNILSAIRGNAELALEETNKADPIYQRLDGIMLSVMLASKLTRQLMLFSRSRPFELAPLDLNKTIEDLLVMINRLIGKDITISTDLAPDLWIIEADEGTMEQVVMNLAVNASDAMPNGGTFSIRTRNVAVTEKQCAMMPEARPGDAVCLTVSDNGHGMNKETLQKIFEPFFTTKEAGKGTGFGLWVVYSIVKQHNGWTAVKSEPGKGTTFNIFLPALRKERRTAAKGPAKAGKDGLGENVLIVDTEPNMVEFARVGLEEHGYKVFTARNGKEAIKAFNTLNGDVQLLVCDVLLPDRSGLTLCEHLRDRKPDLGVVMMSGFADERMKPEILDRKFVYLTKPFSISNLLAAARDALERVKTKGLPAPGGPPRDDAR